MFIYHNTENTFICQCASWSKIKLACRLATQTGRASTFIVGPQKFCSYPITSPCNIWLFFPHFLARGHELKNMDDCSAIYGIAAWLITENTLLPDLSYHTNFDHTSSNVCIVPNISWMLGPLVRCGSGQTRNIPLHTCVVPPEMVVLIQFGTGVGRRV